MKRKHVNSVNILLRVMDYIGLYGAFAKTKLLKGLI